MRRRGFVGSFNVVYSFMGLEVRGLLSKKKDVLLRCILDGRFGGKSWDLMVEVLEDNASAAGVGDVEPRDAAVAMARRVEQRDRKGITVAVARNPQIAERVAATSPPSPVFSPYATPALPSLWCPARPPLPAEPLLTAPPSSLIGAALPPLALLAASPAAALSRRPSVISPVLPNQHTCISFPINAPVSAHTKIKPSIHIEHGVLPSFRPRVRGCLELFLDIILFPKPKIPVHQRSPWSNVVSPFFLDLIC
ncbi:hypothetical protein ABZP36_031076 [Zizania latifolia]